MFCINIAGVVIEIDNIHSHIKEYCSEFICDGTPSFRVKVSFDEIEKFIKERGIVGLTDDVAERILAYKKIVARLAERDMFLLHSSVISYKGHGVAFVASRGVGKTTHAMLWKHSFWGDVEFVNGDKPVIDCRGGTCLACETPWRGKEGLGGKSSVPLEAIVFIERGDKPEITKITPEDAVIRLQNQTIAPVDRGFDLDFAENIAFMLKSVPLYVAKVNTDKESALVVKDYIFG